MSYNDYMADAYENAQRINDHNREEAVRAKYMGRFCSQQAKLYHEIGKVIESIPPSSGRITDLTTYLLQLGIELEEMSWDAKANKYRTRQRRYEDMSPIPLYRDIIPLP